uniref:RNase H type-1 domain-containing protein n=1 Tax=Fagus sylvatica TaxID=28930 RepID=A0A2N9F594_FAGSY
MFGGVLRPLVLCWNKVDADQILKYPLHQSLLEDVLIWWGTPSDMVKIPLKVFPDAMRYIHDYHAANVVPDRLAPSLGNEHGEFFGTMCGLLEYGSDAAEAKALAALKAIEFAADVCPFNMIFEGDCLQVIKALKSTNFDASRLGHCLAQFARNIVGNQVWLESVPPFLPNV